MLIGKDSGHLILNRFGNQMDPNGIWVVVKRHVRISGVKKSVSTHTFRHPCATHMVPNGAPVRHIQELLGHESLESTQIYTRVTINDLKAATGSITRAIGPVDSIPKLVCSGHTVEGESKDKGSQAAKKAA